MIYPVTADDIKPCKRKFDVSDIVINVADKDALQDDVRCDIHTKVALSKEKMGQAITDIDRIRKIDVPWRTYLALYIIIMAVIFGLAYVMLAVMRLYRTTAVLLTIFLILSNTFGFALITYIGFEEEETADSLRLAGLYNQIKTERQSQLNYVRMSLKLRQMDETRSDQEFEGAFVHSLNNLKLQCLKLFGAFGSGKPDGLDCTFQCLREIMWNNPVFMKRLSSELIQAKDIATNGQRFICDVFAIHFPVCFFAAQALALEETSAVCKSNARALIAASKQILSSDAAQSCLCDRLGCSRADVGALMDLTSLNFTAEGCRKAWELYCKA